MFLKFFGKDRDPATLSQRDWDRFIRDRRSGRVGPSGKPVSDRTIERDLRFLLAVLNWAAKSRDEQGQLLLESNPLRGLKTPTEKNPTRVLLTELEYEALLEVSLEMDWRFRLASVIAHETGHRIGAIRQLRWSDIDLESCIIRWRGEHEKTRYEYRTPVSAEALAALEEARRKNPGIGYAPPLPAVPLLHLMRRYLLSIIILGRVFHRTDHEEGRAQGRYRRAPFLDHHPTGTSSRT